MELGRRVVLPSKAEEGRACPVDGCDGTLQLARKRGFWLHCSKYPEDHYREATDPEIKIMQSRVASDPGSLQTLLRRYGGR